MPPWGRPPGAPTSDVGRDAWNVGGYGPRSGQFRELDNSDEDEDGQGVGLHPANYMSKSQQHGFAGDELFFTGYDLGRARDGRRPSQGTYEDVEDYRYQDENERWYYEQQRQAAYLRHGDLVQSVNEKLQRAKEKGKTSVNLSPEEVEALQRSQTPKQREVTPPKTPSKGGSSRSSSTTSQSGKRTNKKASNSRLFSSHSPSSSRNRTSKSSRKSSENEQRSNTSAPPAFMVAGPDGVPIYAPIGYYPPSPEVRPGSSRSRAGSRSASSSVKRDTTPDVDSGYTPYHPSRFYGPPADYSPSRSPYDDGLRNPRNRSASNAQYGSEFFGTPSLPAVQGRRNVSGPADVSFSKVPRMQARSPLAAGESSSSPARKWPQRTDSMPGATPPGTNSSSSSDDSQEGVRVEILPEGQGNGYSIERRPVAGATRRRKGRK